MERIIVPMLVGLAPVLTLLLTWAPGGDMAIWAQRVRGLSLPVLGAEIFVVLLAARHGLSASLRDWLGRWTILLPLAALAAVMAYTTLFVAPDQPSAMLRSFIWVIHFLFGLSIAHLCGRLFEREDLMRAYAGGFVLFAALLGVFALLVSSPQFDWIHALPAVTHIRHLGYYAAAVIGLGVGYLATAHGRRLWLAFFFACLTAFALAFWTGARGTIAASMGAFLVGLVLFPPIRAPRAWLGFAAAGLLGAGIAQAIPTPAAQMGAARTVEATVAPETDVTTGRVDMWRIVLGAVSERPVAGWGEGQMTRVAPFYEMIQPHNVILQLLLAWGLIGTLCIALLAAPLAWRSAIAIRASEGGLLAPAMGAICLAIYALIDGTLFHFQPVSMFAAFLGLVGAGLARRPAASPAG